MPRPEWRDLAKEKHWRRLLARWRRSGQTGRDFCAEHQVSEPSFYFWKREIARRDQERAPRTKSSPAAPQSSTTAAPAFLPVTMATAASSAFALEVVLARGRVLRVRAGFDADALRQLLAVLEAPSC
jgi:hypothetical protein